MKNDRIFILRTDAIRAAATSFVGDLAIADPPLEVIVRRHQDKRSLDQNALYFSWMHVIGDELGYSAEETHEAFKREFLPAIVVNVTGKDHLIPASTTKLAVGEFAQYMDKVSAWAASQGIRLPG